MIFQLKLENFIGLKVFLRFLNFFSVMAVKRIRSTVDEREQKELMDLDVVMKSSDCAYIVTFYGAIFKEGDCWICMELMAISLDKLYKVSLLLVVKCLFRKLKVVDLIQLKMRATNLIR